MHCHMLPVAAQESGGGSLMIEDAQRSANGTELERQRSNGRVFFGADGVILDLVQDFFMSSGRNWDEMLKRVRHVSPACRSRLTVRRDDAMLDKIQHDVRRWVVKRCRRAVSSAQDGLHLCVVPIGHLPERIVVVFLAGDAYLVVDEPEQRVVAL